jgi:opacity protein-like surface antigen
MVQVGVVKKLAIGLAAVVAAGLLSQVAPDAMAAQKAPKGGGQNSMVSDDTAGGDKKGSTHGPAKVTAKRGKRTTTTGSKKILDCEGYASTGGQILGCAKK